MDDIIEKLSLLDYENAFCKGWKHNRISRVYFAHPPIEPEDEVTRVHLLYDMAYWLMSLNKDQVSAKPFAFRHQEVLGTHYTKFLEQEARCLYQL